jgi:hypothetical protein
MFGVVRPSSVVMKKPAKKTAPAPKLQPLKPLSQRLAEMRIANAERKK